MCNATLLNRSFQRCGLNSAEEAARADLTRIEDSLEGLRRRITSATACVRPLMQPTTPAAAPSASENSTFSAHTPTTSAASLPGAQVAAGSVGRGSNGAFGGAAVGAPAGSTAMNRKRLGSVGPLRMTKSGKAYTGLGSGCRTAVLFGGVESNVNGVAASNEELPGSWSVRAQRGANVQGQNVDARGGEVAGRVGGVELNSQQLEKLKVQVRVVEQQLDQIRQMESEVSTLCNEAARQYG